jgi:putative peptidoglycan lipid II flippase
LSPARSGAPLVAAGIFLSRIFGLVRQRVLSHYLGLSLPADAVNQAFRIPNFLQNLFGEGVLSASLIPAYTRLRAERRDAEARDLAWVILGMLGLVVAILVAIGITAAPVLVTLLAPGFEGERRDLTITLVRILFPGVGLLVLSAWCLSILNSHRRFLLSYASPVLWNIAIITATVLAPKGGALREVGIWVAWGAVAGSALQLLIQLPPALALLRGAGAPRTRGRESVGIVLSRGVGQISAFVDGILASLLPGGAVTAMANAQTLYTLPVSLFGMSVAAAELPELATEAAAGSSAHPALSRRLRDGSRRVAFFVVPTMIGFLCFGDVIAALFFETGRFTAADAAYVWLILAGASVGLLAATLSRLYNSVYFALHDTRTPLRFATIRVVLSIMFGYVAAVPLPGLLGLEQRVGAAGITLAAGLAAWVEFFLLRRGLEARIGDLPPDRGYYARIVTAAVAGAAGGGGALLLGAKRLGPVAAAAVVLGAFGVVYLLVTAMAGVPAARRILGRRDPAP